MTVLSWIFMEAPGLPAAFTVKAGYKAFAVSAFTLLEAQRSSSLAAEGQSHKGTTSSLAAVQCMGLLGGVHTITWQGGLRMCGCSQELCKSFARPTLPSLLPSPLLLAPSPTNLSRSEPS